MTCKAASGANTEVREPRTPAAAREGSSPRRAPGCERSRAQVILRAMGAGTSISRALIAPANAQRVETARGSIAYWEPRASVYVTDVRGYMSHEMAALIIERADRLYRPGVQLQGFHNWFAMTNYESSCRVDLTAWVLRRRAQTVLHIGVSSRLVAMGVAVANLALGSLIDVHTAPSSLELALGASLAASD